MTSSACWICFNCSDEAILYSYLYLYLYLLLKTHDEDIEDALEMLAGGEKVVDVDILLVVEYSRLSLCGFCLFDGYQSELGGGSRTDFRDKTVFASDCFVRSLHMDGDAGMIFGSLDIFLAVWLWFWTALVLT